MQIYYKYLIGFLFLATILTWMVVFSLPDQNLHLIACDVGQGDAILAVYKNVQILTDGGLPNGKVVDCISRHIPFWDREIEVVVNTHPQLDHYGGLIEVVKRYKIDNFIGNGLDASANEYQVLKKEVGSKGIRILNPHEGMVVRYGMISYDIFWPSFAFLASEGMPTIENKLSIFSSKRDPNDFSVQAILSLGEFDALLTGDIGSNMAEMILPYLPNKSVEYIKIPHHGSKNGMTADYLKTINPKVAVISLGENNTYGHPHKEILQILNEHKLQILRTDEMGDIEVVTDGKNYWVKK